MLLVTRLDRGAAMGCSTASTGCSPSCRPVPTSSSRVAEDTRLADLGQLTGDERATIIAVIDAITTKAKLRLITGGAS